MGLAYESARIAVLWIAIYALLLAATFLELNPLNTLLYSPLGMFMVFCGLIGETLFMRL